jgi:hypothetical protein
MEKLLQRLYGWHGFLLVDQGFVSHLGWGIALPLVGHFFFGRWGTVTVAVLWIAYAFVREFIEEANEPTRWSDIASRCAGAVLFGLLDLLRR